MSTNNPQREFALQVVQRLREAGYEALWAGGCVRDQLLGRAPKDYDIATSARPEQVRDVFGHRRTLAIGAAFGVIAVLGGRDRDPIEVATFRSDGAYHDGRHPTEVVFTTAKEDAQRRDFTINGMFYDPVADEVVDYVCGEDDLRQGIIRAIGDPDARFAEDKLRMLRAVRFATTFGFEIEAPTLAAIQAMAAEIKVVSAERIGTEVGRMLVHRDRARGLQLLQDSGLLEQLLPELFAIEQPKWQETLGRLTRLETDSLSVVLAGLFWEVGDTGLVRDVGRRFRLTNKAISRAGWLVEQVLSAAEAATLRWPRLQRVLVHEGASDLMALATAVWGEEHPGVVRCREKLALPPEQLNPPLLLTGDDLVAHGLQPGRHFATLLDQVRDAQLDGLVSNRQEALALVDQLG